MLLAVPFHHDGQCCCGDLSAKVKYFSWQAKYFLTDSTLVKPSPPLSVALDVTKPSGDTCGLPVMGSQTGLQSSLLLSVQTIHFTALTDKCSRIICESMTFISIIQYTFWIYFAFLIHLDHFIFI